MKPKNNLWIAYDANDEERIYEQLEIKGMIEMMTYVVTELWLHDDEALWVAASTLDNLLQMKIDDYEAFHPEFKEAAQSWRNSADKLGGLL